MLERERIIEIVVAVFAVALMIGVMIGIGSIHGGHDSVLSSEGAELLVWAIVGFIVLLTAVGVGLAYVMNEPGDGLEDEDAETQSPA
ncbi:DUF7472 family protein [Natronobacterium gregoryi]|uniref:Uncharacterized protein n=2 Tax=Natronobacterium gregoryi TaxID=44930 RepID=L0AI19_NATGS|nr:hypothetical protein [Natronobacterium gregoryi]AFZ72690.1 hypothetical protein Natgr_1481 [Natronobacterium gregoryi SP2]ELY69017.1 hypothetical protein C490_08501 [Natronobacterium gregoryi SP2]PLK20642.1 hypothetical protein CYV19_08555 [Natronobacterium gregoryi SP2]SFI91768.1 hypothetical protein SAMN05443661_10972 [Natronobacterium gregoryi]